MRYFIQTTGETTAAASLMVIINHFQPSFALSRANEFRIWRESANLPVLASSIYGLAAFAARQGLKPKIVLENPDFYYPNYRFMGYRRKDIDRAKFSSELYRREAQDLEIPVEERQIGFDEVRELAIDGKVLLLRVNEAPLRQGKNVSKYIVVYGFEQGHFLVVSAHQGIMRVSEDVLKEAFSTLETKSKRDHRMIIFE